MYEALRERLAQPDIDPDKPFATEQSLTEEFGVSRVTVRKALQLLEDQGLVVRRKRLGIFPLRPLLEVSGADSVTDLTRRAEWLNQTTSVRLISCRRVIAPVAAAEKLALPRDTRVLKFERVRHDARGSLAHLTTYIADPAAKLLTRAELLDRPPIALLPKKAMTSSASTRRSQPKPPMRRSRDGSAFAPARLCCAPPG